VTDDRKGGLALITGAIGGLITMALHPTGHDLLGAGDQFAHVAALGTFVHTLAIASMPVSFLGALALSRRLAAPDRLAVAAIVVYGFALAAGLVAAAASGFVAPGIAHAITTTAPPASDTWRILFDFNGRLNQAFARILAVGSSTAIILWSVAIVRSRVLAPGAGFYGLAVGTAIVVAVGSGHLRLDVHGFGLVVLLQAVWLIAVGTLLWRLARPDVSLPAR
jgi:hypothetical protein